MKAKRYCITSGCQNNDINSNVTFFTLPKENERCQEWLKLVGRTDLLARENFNRRAYAVCGDHFKASDIKHITFKHIKHGAIPTFRLPNQTNEDTPSSPVKIKQELEEGPLEVTSQANGNKKTFTVSTQTVPQEESTDTAVKRKLLHDIKNCENKRQKTGDDGIQITEEFVSGLKVKVEDEFH